MLFLAGLLNRSSLTFLTVTVVRVFSVVAIILGVAAEIFLLVDGIDGVKSAPSTSTSTSTSTPHGAGNSTTSTAISRDAVLASQTELCGYIGGTDVPKSFGGILFFSLAQLFNIVVLVLCLLSELSPPRIPEFFEYVMPPLGQNFGVGFIGAFELFVACALLSHNVKIFPSVAGWFLFVLGWLNIMLGVIFGPRIRAKRSVTQAGKAYVKKATHYDDVEKGVQLGRKGFELGKKGYNMAKAKKGSPKKSDISGPAPPPPTYDGQPVRTFDGPWERNRTASGSQGAPSIAPSVRTFEGPREVRFPTMGARPSEAPMTPRSVRFGGQEEIRDGHDV